MLDVFLKIYIAISPLLIITTARAVAVAKHFRRTPAILEILDLPNSVPKHDLAWLGAVNKFWCFWLVIFLFSHIQGITLSDDHQKLIKGYVAITALNVACCWHSLQSIKNYARYHPGCSSVREENSDFIKRIDIFPGFRGFIDSFISAGTIVLLICIASLVFL